MLNRKIGGNENKANSFLRMEMRRQIPLYNVIQRRRCEGTTTSAFCSTQKLFNVCVADQVQMPTAAGGKAL